MRCSLGYVLLRSENNLKSFKLISLGGQERQEIDRGRVHVYSTLLNAEVLQKLTEIVNDVGGAKKAADPNDNDSDDEDTADAKDKETKTSEKSRFAALAEDLRKLPPDAVVFNFECCSGCSKESGFTGCNQQFASFAASAVAQGFMLMCSDFSLKALISHWPSDLVSIPRTCLRVCLWLTACKITQNHTGRESI